MSTTIIYNGVEIRNVLTDNISYTPEYLNGSYVFTRIAITGRGVAFRGAISGGAETGYQFPGGVGLADGMSALGILLNAPQRPFHYYINGVLWFSVYPSVAEGCGIGVTTGATLSNSDVDYGPKPSFTVAKIVSDKSANVSFTINLSVVLCDGQIGANTVPDIIFARFWVADDIDCTDWLTTRATSGQIRVAHKNISAHAFRKIMLPPLPAGFQRRMVKFAESPDGLTLDFQCLDQELVACAPRPASDWNANQSFSAPNTFGQHGSSAIDIMLKGPKTVSKRQLIAMAFEFIDRKFHITDTIAGHTVFLENFEFNYSYKENVVNAAAQIKAIGENGSLVLANILDLNGELGFLPQLTETVEGGAYDPQIGSLENPSTNLGCILVSYLTNPCCLSSYVQQTDIYHDSGGLRTVDRMPGFPGNNLNQSRMCSAVMVEQSQLKQWTHSKVKADGEQNIITDYQAESSLQIDEGKVQMPIGKQLGGSDGRQSKIIKSHNPVATRRIRGEGEGLMKPPKMPGDHNFTDSQGVVHIVSKYYVVPFAPQVSADGHKTLHRVDFDIEYVLDRVPDINQHGIPGASLPYITYGAQNFTDIASALLTKPSDSDSLVKGWGAATELQT